MGYVDLDIQWNAETGIGFDLYLSTMLHWRSKVRAIMDTVVKGWVVTVGSEKWFHRSSGRGDNRPVILDNGAYGRFMQDLPPEEPGVTVARVVENARSCQEFGHPVYITALPDVVGDWDETLRVAGSVEYPDDLPWYLILQDGFTVSEVEGFLTSHDVGLFIGGSSHKFKRDAVEKVKHLSPAGLHVGRVSSLKDCMWAWNHQTVRSIDNSSWSRTGLRSAHNGRRDLEAMRRLSILQRQKRLDDFVQVGA